MRSRRFTAVLCAVAMIGFSGLGGCAAPSKTNPEAAEDNDPFESVNRKVWAFDMELDRYFLKPVAEGYRAVMPDIAQTGISNVLSNIKSPIVFANDLLQGNITRAGETLERLTLNTLLGAGGLIDVAGNHGLRGHEADFGQTLGVWGIDSGPYLVLPLLGPSNPRDGIGYGVDSLIDPFSIKMRAANIDQGNYIRWGVSVVSDRTATIDQLDEVKKESLDFYAAIRSLYQQQRAAAVAAGKSGSSAPVTDLSVGLQTGSLVSPAAHRDEVR
ncbi:MAG TPA: VacJ family lipoprotein [Stellaceae bacterium]|nr:VacJ family lipoprotein [Stellaceae bacterium]